MARPIYFTPILCLDYMALEHVSMLQLIDTFAMQERWFRNDENHEIRIQGSLKLAITDVRGHMFSLMVNRDKDDAKGQKTVSITVWDDAGTHHIIQRGCTLNADGCLSRADAHFIHEKMQRFSEGDFNCDQCGREVRRFTPGCDSCFAGHVCPECAKSAEFRRARGEAYAHLD